MRPRSLHRVNGLDNYSTCAILNLWHLWNSACCFRQPKPGNKAGTFMSYSAWKLVHLISVVLFLGNIITGLFWAAHAKRSRNVLLIEGIFDGIIRSDRWFTMPGVVGILVSGFAAASIGGMGVLRVGWIFWSLALFALSGVVFGLHVAPLQKRIRALAEDEMDWNTFEALYRRWEIWGVVAFVTPLLATVLMVLKPSLPGI